MANIRSPNLPRYLVTRPARRLNVVFGKFQRIPKDHPIKHLKRYSSVKVSSGKKRIDTYNPEFDSMKQKELSKV